MRPVTRSAAAAAVLLTLTLASCDKEGSEQPRASGAAPLTATARRTSAERPPPSPKAETWPHYLVVTRGTPGFRDRLYKPPHYDRSGGKFYPLGINSAEIIKDFGPQDYGVPTATLDYHAIGLKVQVLNDRPEVSGYIFYTDPANREFRPAPVMTDGGITGDATFEEIVAAHGEPDKDETFSTTRWVGYPWGGFRFTGGKLDSIHIRPSAGE